MAKPAGPRASPSSPARPTRGAPGPWRRTSKAPSSVPPSAAWPSNPDRSTRSTPQAVEDAMLATTLALNDAPPTRPLLRYSSRDALLVHLSLLHGLLLLN